MEAKVPIKPSFTVTMEADGYMKESPNRAIKNYMFLSKEWIVRAVSEIEKAKATNKELRTRVSDINFRIAYKIIRIPRRVAELYGSNQVVVYFKLDHGFLKDFLVMTETPKDVDLTVAAEYAIIEKIFKGELDPLTAFTNFMIKVEPFRKLFLNPLSSAKLLSIANDLLRLIKNVPTVFPEQL